ncbi:hypothetical protein HRbin38_00446 [bacterium HR38]|nr:hypothetical protein HRbin38_00446 [bacterium HR38]
MEEGRVVGIHLALGLHVGPVNQSAHHVGGAIVHGVAKELEGLLGGIEPEDGSFQLHPPRGSELVVPRGLEHHLCSLNEGTGKGSLHLHPRPLPGGSHHMGLAVVHRVAVQGEVLGRLIQVGGPAFQLHLVVSPGVAFNISGEDAGFCSGSLDLHHISYCEIGKEQGAVGTPHLFINPGVGIGEDLLAKDREGSGVQVQGSDGAFEFYLHLEALEAEGVSLVSALSHHHHTRQDRAAIGFPLLGQGCSLQVQRLAQKGGLGFRAPHHPRYLDCLGNGPRGVHLAGCQDG